MEALENSKIDIAPFSLNLKMLWSIGSSRNADGGFKRLIFNWWLFLLGGSFLRVIL